MKVHAIDHLGESMDPDTLDWEMEYLESRINRFHLNQRLGIEKDRESWVLGQGRNLFHLENWYSVHGLIRGSLKLLNLHKRGQRNALDLKINRLDIHLQDLPESFKNFTLLHISDLHLDMHPELPATLAATVQGLDYDLCVMTGDYRALTWGSHTAAIDGLKIVRPSLKGDVYCILGNHDTVRMVPHMEHMGLKVLLNESVPIERQGDRIYLGGIDDPHYFRSDNMQLTCDNIPQDSTSILLSHSPEMYKHATFAEFDLMLCGHTHGGQICLPGGYPVLLNANCPRRMCVGLWEFGAMQGYTSVGSGASVVDVRFNCPPEVTLLRLI